MQRNSVDERGLGPTANAHGDTTRTRKSRAARESWRCLLHSPTAPGHPWRPQPRPGVFGIQTCPRIFLPHFSGAPRRRDGSTICFLVRGRGAAMHKSGGFPSPDPSTRHRPRARQCTAIDFQTTLQPCCETNLVTVAQRNALHQDLARKNALESTEAEARDGCRPHQY